MTKQPILPRDLPFSVRAAVFNKLSQQVLKLAAKLDSVNIILRTLSIEGPLTVPQVARRLGLKRQSVQKIANRLVSEGWSVFQENRDHKKSQLLKLTAQGMKRAAKDIDNEALRYTHHTSEQKLEELVKRLEAFNG